MEISALAGVIIFVCGFFAGVSVGACLAAWMGEGWSDE